jgi:3-oxoacyl-[acyl-carrier protein] reductase
VASDDRVVLVTGASPVIGRAVAARFAERGAIQETLAGLPGTGHRAMAADLADPEAVAALGASSVRPAGIDVLVNNAGIYVAHPGAVNELS